ncbi:MAG: Fe-S cluster assembly transcriptional regulator IscR [Pseudomonadales bacterium]|uniref:Rrf2 family protein n=1 Tax=Oleiphilus messinensis TaxID=141451 RepID=A0A1Y0I7W0_9GAMM|nr:Fe-S cluster assembly transcriptional regulator IscR [Oleiphilus messinensis]ARU56541.1 rrf2 family protein [Oleiphilus messinensis]MCG8613202.1 Fe-S cluster assembly transcriptional regulator IscR [Pseudomonadales bacterium]
MRLTTKGRYAVTAMLDLALHSDQGPVSLSDISARQGISLSYLEQLFAKLRNHSLVKSVRGPGGGYLLGCDQKEIYIAQVVDAVNESMDTTRCQQKGNCQNGEKCLTHHLWADLSQQIHGFLSSISLYDLMAKREVQVIAARQNRLVEDQRHQATLEHPIRPPEKRAGQDDASDCDRIAVSES